MTRLQISVGLAVLLVVSTLALYLNRAALVEMALERSVRDTMAAEELRGRVHDDVGTKLRRPAQVGRGKGVVDHQGQGRGVRDLGDSRDVDHFQARIAERFAKQ